MSLHIAGFFYRSMCFAGGSTLEYIVTNETLDLDNENPYMLMTCLARHRVVAKMHYVVRHHWSSEKTYPVSYIRKISFIDDFAERAVRFMFLELMEEVGADFVFDKEHLDAQEKEILRLVGYPVLEDAVADILCDAFDTRSTIYHMVLDMRMNGADHKEDGKQAMSRLAELAQAFNRIGHVISYRVTPSAPQSARAAYRNALQIFEDLRQREMRVRIFTLDSMSNAASIPFSLLWLDPIYDALDQAETVLRDKLGISE